MTGWQVVIPCIGPSVLLYGCLTSMLTPAETPSTPVLVVDNSADGLHIPNWCEVERHPDNLGVAASWNRGLARDADLTLLLSASMRFANGLDAFVEAATLYANPYGLTFAEHSFHAIAIGRRLVERIGFFDEGFWPCEYEDADYRHRMHMAGIPIEHLPNVGDLGLTCVGNSIAGHLGLVPKSDGPRERYLAKWGGDPGAEQWDVPHA